MPTVLLTRDKEHSGLATITLNRPDKLNALSWDVHQELQRVCADLQDDTDTRVVILTGAGRAFSAGADLTSFAPGPPKSDLERRKRAHIGGRTCAMLEGLEQVTIGAVNGLAVGGATVLLSCLDLRVAARSSWFWINEVDLDLPLTWQALPRLMRELGPARTRELVMTCRKFSSAEALEWGFVNHVYPDRSLMKEARSLAATLLSMDPLSLAQTKFACRALARLMVPEEATWADADVMLLAYRQQALRRASSTDVGAPGKAARKAALGPVVVIVLTTSPVARWTDRLSTPEADVPR